MTNFIFLAPKSLWTVTAATKLKDTCSLEEKLWQTRPCIKNKKQTLLTKIRIVKAMVFPVVMYGCERHHKEGWAPKNLCFRIVALEKTLESLLDCTEIKPVNQKGDQPWIFHCKDWCWSFSTLTAWWEEPLMLGKIEGNDRGWDGWMASPTQQTWVWANSEDSERQGSLACCGSWGCKESNTNNNNANT